jgi:hypothetical protein
VLRASPFEIPWGSSINARVYSMNVVGQSEYSSIGNGAVILSIPSEPRNLANDAAASTSSDIKFTWYAPSETGGTPVIDYRVYYDQGDPSTTDFIALESNILDTEFTATSLTMGLAYRFKVAARNSVGYSALSEEV